MVRAEGCRSRSRRRRVGAGTPPNVIHSFIHSFIVRVEDANDERA